MNHSLIKILRENLFLAPFTDSESVTFVGELLTRKEDENSET